MATIAQIRAALASQIAAGLAGYQVSAWVLASPTPPCIYIQDGELRYNRLMGPAATSMEVDLRIVALIPFTSDRHAQEMADSLRDPASPSSIQALAESDRTLGGLVSAINVQTASPVQVYDRQSGPPVVGCEWQLTVYP